MTSVCIERRERERERGRVCVCSIRYNTCTVVLAATARYHLYMCCTCAVHVFYMWYTCVLHVNEMSLFLLLIQYHQSSLMSLHLFCIIVSMIVLSFVLISVQLNHLYHPVISHGAATMIHRDQVYRLWMESAA